MQSDKYFLFLSGTLIDGHEREQVEAALQRLLRVPAEQARSMLAGERSRIRKPLSLEKAKHLRDKCAACGAGSFIVPVESKDTRSQPRTTAASSEGQLNEAVESGVPVTAAAAEDLRVEPLSEASQAATEASSAPMEKAKEAGVAQEHTTESPVKLDATPSLSTTEDEPEAAADDALGLALVPLAMAEPEAGEEDTRPLQAVDADEEIDPDTEIVLESEMTALESTGGTASPAARRDDDSSEPASKRQPPALAGKRRLLIGGVLVVLAGIAGALYFFDFEVSPGNGAEQQTQPQPQAESKRALTQQRLESLGRSVRAWIKFYGSGDPEQLTLDRMQQDLVLPEAEMLDAWGTAIAYQPGGASYTMLSAGPDRMFGTADDLKREMEMK